MKKGVELPSLWWRDIEGYKGLYHVSIDGEIKSLRSGKILKPWKNKDGYLVVNLWKDGKRKNYLVHRLVAQAFIPNPDNKPCINHISEIKTDNRVENLEWTTPKGNTNWGTRNERAAKAISKALTNRKDLSKPVVALNKREQIVHVFPSAKEAGRNGHDQGAVSACCRGEKKHHHGLIWRYQNDFLQNVC